MNRTVALIAVARDGGVKMQVRLAQRDDVSAIQSVGRKTWAATYAFAGEDYIANGLNTWWSVEALERSLETTTCLVADNGGELLGIGNIDLRGEVPVIWKLYVVPESQGVGVGSALLGGLLAQVPSGTSSVCLEYVAGNERAARFYASKQFEELGREPADRPGWPELVWLERRLDAAASNGR